MDPEEKCQCGHERKWHDACSRCSCAYFLPKGADEGDVLIWKRRRRDRGKAEKGLN